jgi:hypothetical protein
MQFLLDTGGAGTHVDKGVAEKLQFELGRGVATTSGNESLEVGVIRSAAIRVGPTRFEGRFIASPLAQLEPIFGRRIEGILGSDWMNRHVVELDFVQQKMRLYEPATFRYNGRGTTLPLTFAEGIPFVELEISLPNGKTVKGSFLVDTGGGLMVVHIHKRIADRDGLLEGLTMLAETGVGIGGAADRLAARGSLLSIGPYRIVQPTIKFTNDPAGLRANPGSVGLVGMEVFRKFKVTFDYSRKVVHLEPNRFFDEPLVYDATGLRLRAAPPAFSPPFVAFVRDASPGKEAGIAPGDILLKLDGRNTSELSLETVREMLHAAGKSHRLQFSRNGKIMKVILKTREMLP